MTLLSFFPNFDRFYLKSLTKSLTKLHRYTQNRVQWTESLQTQAVKHVNVHVLTSDQPTYSKTELYLSLTGSDWLICCWESQSVSTLTPRCEGILGCRGKVSKQTICPSPKLGESTRTYCLSHDTRMLHASGEVEMGIKNFRQYV